jgi:hypothetical protein
MRHLSHGSKRPSLTRYNSNAWTEVAAMNRCVRFPAFICRRAPHGGRRPAGLSGQFYLASVID